eukprot:Pgem_evm1s18008
MICIVGECYGELLTLGETGVVWRVQCSQSQIVVGASTTRNEACLRVLDFDIPVDADLDELNRENNMDED